MKRPTKFSDLEEAIQSVAADPSHYHDFIEAWDELVQEPQFDPLSANAKAKDALHQLQQNEQKKKLRNAMARDINKFPYPTWMTKSNGDVLAANHVAEANYAIGPNDNISALKCELFESQNLNASIRTLFSKIPTRSGITLKRAYDTRSGKPFTLALLPSRVSIDNAPTALFFIIDAFVDGDAYDLIQSNFDLTDAEIQILRLFLEGFSLNDIAEKRGRSLATVRTQFNIILSKTETNSQSELVRSCLGLIRFTSDVEQLAEANKVSNRKFAEVLRPGGRSVEVMLVGDPSARPLLYLHGAFVNYMPPRIEDVFIRAGYFIIGVTRPGFAKTSPAPPNVSNSECLTHDVAAVLNQLEIDGCPVLAHSTSTHHAFALSAELSQRILALVFAAGWPPPEFIKHISSRSTWSRAMMAAAMKAPILLNVMSRAGIALFKSRGAASQAAKAVADSPADVATVSRRDAARELESWIEHGSLPGIDAGLDDIAMMLKDWNGYVSQIDVPIVYVHGNEDPHVPVGILRQFAAAHPGKIDVLEVPSAGHFALWQNPYVFVSVLGSLYDTRKIAD